MKLTDVDYNFGSGVMKTAEDHESVIDSIMSGKTVPASMAQLQEDLNKIAAEHDKKEEKKESKKEEKEEKKEDKKDEKKDDKKEGVCPKCGKPYSMCECKDEKKASAMTPLEASQIILAEPGGADFLKLSYAIGELEAEAEINEKVSGDASFSAAPIMNAAHSAGSWVGKKVAPIANAVGDAAIGSGFLTHKPGQTGGQDLRQASDNATPIKLPANSPAASYARGAFEGLGK
jgi:hypothetical protein